LDIIGIEPGTVVISDKVFNAYLKSEHLTVRLIFCVNLGVLVLLPSKVILGKPVVRPAEIDQPTAKEIFQCGVENGFNPLLGGTMCTDDFYEGNVFIMSFHTCSCKRIDYHIKSTWLFNSNELLFTLTNSCTHLCKQALFIIIDICTCTHNFFLIFLFNRTSSYGWLHL